MCIPKVLQRQAKPRLLLVYEETNENLDPWLERFREALHTKQDPFDEEPVRKWLSQEGTLSHREVGLSVSSATETLTAEAKTSLVEGFVGRLPQ